MKAAGGDSAEYANRPTWARRGGAVPVDGEKRTAETFGERDVAGVVGGEVVAQLVGAAHEGEGGVAVELEQLQVVDRGLEPACGEAARKPAATQHGDRLDINQIGCGQLAG